MEVNSFQILLIDIQNVVLNVLIKYEIYAAPAVKRVSTNVTIFCSVYFVLCTGGERRRETRPPVITRSCGPASAPAWSSSSSSCVEPTACCSCSLCTATTRRRSSSTRGSRTPCWDTNTAQARETTTARRQNAPLYTKARRSRKT